MVASEILAGRAVSEKEISGALELRHATFTKHVKFVNCDFADEVELSGSRFERGVEFIGCQFARKVSLESCTIDGELHLRACVFKDEACFERLWVNGKLEARAPRNNKELHGNIHEFGIKPYIIFEGFADFAQIHIKGEANFGSAQFENGTDFYNARFDGPVFFRQDYCKSYRRAKEKAEELKNQIPPVIVEPLKLDPTAFPDEVFRPVCFKGDKARFRDAYFGGELNLHATEFVARADFSYA
jgi:hypothetical protein